MAISWILRISICLLCCETCFAELKLLQTVFRHGNRIPTAASYYPKDPYVNLTYYPAGRGGLTNAGKMLIYKLGQYFRERYDKFLGPIYVQEDIYFRADHVERVVMTAELVAAGLYPPHKVQRWNPALNWQPIPVWTLPLSEDYLYNGLNCEGYRVGRTHVEETDEAVNKFKYENADVYTYLSEHTGGVINQSSTFVLRQFLFAQEDIGLKLPEWTKAVYPHGKLDELAVYDILIQSRTLQMKQLLGGIWIREWLMHVDNHLSKNDTRKAFMYAAHDLTIAAILVALDNYDYQIPYYGSSLMFELHEENDEYYVQILHKNKNDVRILKFPNCGEICSLDEFKKIVMPVIPVDPRALCKQK